VRRLYFPLILSFICIGLHGQNVKLYLKAAEQYIANGYFEDAITQYNKAIEIDPQNGEAFQERAKSNEQLKYLSEAAQDYKSAAVFGFNSAENYLKSSQLLYQLKRYPEAAETVSKAIINKSGYYEAYLMQCQILIASGIYEEANVAALNAFNAKGTAYAHYLMGITEFELREYPKAEEDFKKAISKDKLLLEAYIALARVQLISKETQFAIENCNIALSLDPKNKTAYFIRSLAYGYQRDFISAIADISSAISIDSLNPEYFVQRGEYYMNSIQYDKAIKDFTLVLNYDLFDARALKLRGEAFEKNGDMKKALSDYSLLLTILDDSQTESSLIIKQKIFELNRENNRPEIILLNPVLNDNQEVMIPNNSLNVTVKASIKDASLIRFVKINNDTILNSSEGVTEKEFHTVLPFSGLDFITLTAMDIYENVSTISYAVEGIETKSPDIKLLIPYPDYDSLICLTDDDHFLYLEGRIEDENLISSVNIDEVTASFAPRDQNPRFTATIDISKKNKILVQATDIYGNTSQRKFLIQRNDNARREENPMGKTWVILIENSEYKDFPNLNSPATDIELMQLALARYQINKIIVKKNLTKREMERFFSIDLRDLVRANEVNSLFLWFAGHGKNIKGTGYWIPADANANDEFSFFNINALKASLYSYTSLSHVLVVSDACETGQGFCLALRGPIEDIACSNTDLAYKKSAQVFTSAGSGYAYDNSFFTRAFANTLLNNEDDCSSIEDIVKRVSLIMQTNSPQSPEFGRIPGLTDELGTFFFYSF
jgi:tetratricopeptide (TPR) repeat protein